MEFTQLGATQREVILQRHTLNDGTLVLNLLMHTVFIEGQAEIATKLRKLIIEKNPSNDELLDEIYTLLHGGK